MSNGECWRLRLVARLERCLPAAVLDEPERVLINAACVLMGLGAIIGGQPGSLIALWPRWVAYEWASAMLIGGGCALVGFLRGKRPLARLGYLLVMIGALVYGTAVLVVFGWGGIAPGMIFLGLAVAKLLRLVRGSVRRNAILNGGGQGQGAA